MPERAMRCITPHDLDLYMKTDRIAPLLREWERPGDEALTIHRWLRDTPAKRMVFDDMYGDLLFNEGRRLRVLDVGGGVTALTRLLARRHDYHLVDIFAHESAALIEPLRRDIGRVFWSEGDWYTNWPQGPFDLIVANDLFPNADQRLGVFLDRALRDGAELRISLTFYNTMRYYITRRVDADEILCMQAYNGEQTAAVLARYRDRIEQPDFTDFLRSDRPSLYENGRQVALVRLRGTAQPSGRS